jgi:hypothetical protein
MSKPENDISFEEMMSRAFAIVKKLPKDEQLKLTGETFEDE